MIDGSGSRVLGGWFRVWRSGVWVEALEFRVQCLQFRFGVQGFGFRFQVLRFRV